ncbi:MULTISPECIES: DUF979 domain-containing protein [unclassified Novosphingobium]|uniref:DUF979 domain-containing protein n=1 Tax=unclassified Novosphingobium TaxID=2644732 RepID=UPI0025D1D1B8|nr:MULTISPECIES: DUF979 domain-containing protein [unclassified Novosphingobium]HQV04666.1 DUF979 domain-containing protein [Novosphingobium sp.]
MIGLSEVYLLAGAVFAAFAALSAREAGNPKRWGNAAFWALLALSMLTGDRLGDFANGLLVLALVAIAGLGGLGRGAAQGSAAMREAEAARHGNRLFLLALVIPLVALIGTLGFKALPDLVDPKNVTLVSLALGVLIALAIGMAWLRAGPAEPLHEGRRLMDSVGWAAILPQMLASLGAVFALAGVGKVVGAVMTTVIPDGSRLAAVIAYGLGMALFTMVMGNAFAAFPVMAAAIGLPLLIGQYHGDPAVVAAIGMLAGFCGTLMTPMAANFNVVPAALLELKDRNAVVKAQIPTALPLLAVNIALIWFLAF